MRKIIANITVPFVIWLLAYYFGGVTTVTATADGRPIDAVVKVNGKRVGYAPYSDRLGFGEFTITVVPLNAGKWQEREYMYDLRSVVLGADVNAEFHQRIEED